MKLSVCIPMYNESLIAADTAAALWQAMDALRRAHGWDFEIIFADDGSRDDCAGRVRAGAAGRKLDGARVGGYEYNRGKGAAARAAVLPVVLPAAEAPDLPLRHQIPQSAALQRAGAMLQLTSESSQTALKQQ